MSKLLKINLTTILLVIFSVAFSNCVPTSVLVNTKDSKLNNSKVKRSSNINLSSLPSSSSASSSENQKPDIGLHLNNGGHTKQEISLGTSQSIGLRGETKATPQKRGINSQLMYGDIFNSPPTGQIPNGGVWGNEIDPSIMYPDVQDFDEYPRGSAYRPKPYDSLQSILNAEMYPEPVALPLQYPYRYYGDRKKRSNKKNSYDMRLKRESKLTPADMLALVALVEAGERSRQEAELEETSHDYGKSYLSPYSSQIDDDSVIGGEYPSTWSSDPALDYYGSIPYNLDTLPRYIKDDNLGTNYYPSKRYMVAKKKRSLGYFLNEPVAMPSAPFDNRYAMPELYGKGPKHYQKYF